jgi:hypothetical protein
MALHKHWPLIFMIMLVLLSLVDVYSQCNSEMGEIYETVDCEASRIALLKVEFVEIGDLMPTNP